MLNVFGCIEHRPRRVEAVRRDVHAVPALQPRNRLRQRRLQRQLQAVQGYRGRAAVSPELIWGTLTATGDPP